MTVTPIFHGAVTDQGKLKLERPLQFQQCIRGLAGKRVELTVRKPKSKRSLDQNAYWHGVAVAIMAEFMGEDNAATHYAMLGECFGYHWNEKLKKEVPNKGSSSALTVEEFSHLIEWAPRWASDSFGVVIPLPNEVEVES